MSAAGEGERSRQEYAVIAGFGLPGRAVAEALEERGVPYCVIERNVDTVSRCLRGGTRIIEGDAAERSVLERAEVGRATLFAVAVPEEEVMLRVVRAVREMNAWARIVARCTYTSTGMKALAAGADQVIVAEKAVAGEFARLAKDGGR